MNVFAFMSTTTTTCTRFRDHYASDGDMRDDWKKRLLDAIDSDGRSGRSISAKLKLGPNTISELRNTEKTPSFDKVLKLIDEIGASRSYIILGYDIGPEEEELLSVLAELGPGALSAALELVRARAAVGPKEPPASPHPTSRETE